MKKEHDALTNMAMRLGLTIHQYHKGDKRRKTRRYFAQKEGETMSPILDFDSLKYFLLGWVKSNSERARWA